MSNGNGKFQWYTGPGKDAESWSGPYSTRDKAIAQGRIDYDGGFSIYEADKSVVVCSFNVGWLAEQVLEDLAEHNEECWGEEGWDDAWGKDDEKALEQALEAAVTQWLKTHPGKTWAAGDIRVDEYIEAEVSAVSTREE